MVVPWIADFGASRKPSRSSNAQLYCEQRPGFENRQGPSAITPNRNGSPGQYQKQKNVQASVLCGFPTFRLRENQRLPRSHAGFSGALLAEGRV